MRTATLAVAVSALVCVIAAFLPVGHLDVGGRLFAAKTSRSLWALGHSSDGVRDFLASYKQSTAKKLGAKVLDKVADKLPGRARARAGDVQDVMATLDELRDEDVKLVGQIVAGVLWGVLGLSVALALLAWGLTPRSHALRLIGTIALAVILAALTVAVHLVLERVVREANAEVERELFTLRYGATLLPVGGVGALLASVLATVGFVRGRRHGLGPHRSRPTAA